MKKMFFAVCAVLLALAIFSCVDTIVPENGPDGYTEDGRPMKSLTIRTGGVGRALTGPLAKAGADFYEVSFFDGTNYYRKSWNWAETGKIIVPFGDYYMDSAKAILFAGRMSDKTLLAVGYLTAATGSTTLNEIDGTTTSVTFTLTPLTSDVKADGTSTFQITEAGYETSSVPSPFPTARIDGGPSIPMFKIPADSTATAEFEFMPTATMDDYKDGIYVLPDAAGSVWGFYSSGVSSTSSSGPLGLVEVLGAFTAPNPNALLSASTDNNIIGFTLTSPGAPDTTDGLGKIAFAVPVCAIAAPSAYGAAIDKIADPITWYIKGGLQNGFFDEGKDRSSPGGAILLGVGSVSPIDIIVTP